MIFNDRFINEKLFLNKDSFTIKKISDDEYFGNEYKHCISNSKLRYISPSQNGSPFEYKYGNQNESASFLDVGTIPVLDGIRFLGLPLYDADQLDLLRFGIVAHCNESLSMI